MDYQDVDENVIFCCGDEFIDEKKELDLYGVMLMVTKELKAKKTNHVYTFDDVLFFTDTIGKAKGLESVSLKVTQNNANPVNDHETYERARYPMKVLKEDLIFIAEHLLLETASMVLNSLTNVTMRTQVLGSQISFSALI